MAAANWSFLSELRSAYFLTGTFYGAVLLHVNNYLSVLCAHLFWKTIDKHFSVSVDNNYVSLVGGYFLLTDNMRYFFSILGVELYNLALKGF